MLSGIIMRINILAKHNLDTNIPVLVSNKCNNRCLMCSVNLDNNHFKEPSVDEILNIIGSSRGKYICLIGGEPTIREDFYQLMTKLRQNFPERKIILFSNARSFSNKEFLKGLRISKPDSVVVTLHSHTAEIHNKITQTDSFNSTITGIKNLINAGIDVKVRVIINALNYKQLLKISEYILSNFSGIKKVEFINPIIQGRAKINKILFLVKYTKIRPYLLESVNILKNADIKVNTQHFPLCIFEFSDIDDQLRIITETHGEIVMGLEQCNICTKSEKCPRVMKEYVEKFGSNEFNQI